MIQYLLFASLLVSSFSAELPKLPNIGFLGRGYDIVRASPRPVTEPIDSGFVSGILDMTSYKLGRLTADGKHAVPDYTDIVECNACQLAYQSSMISGAKSYRSAMNKPISGGADGLKFGVNFRFRAGESYIHTVEETDGHNNVLIDSSASCIVYCAELRLPIKPTNLDEAFVEAVRLLPVDYKAQSGNNAQTYYAFLSKFGTHIVSAMRSGSLFWQRSSFSGSNFARAERELDELDVEVAAGLAFIRATFNYQTQQETEVADKLSNYTSSMTLHSIGIPPPTKQGPYNTSARWLAETREAPMPIEFSLMPITRLLNSQFFPTDKDIDRKRENVATIVDDGAYCGYLAHINRYEGEVNCAEEKPDNLDFRKRTKSNFGGTYYKADYSGVDNLANPMNGYYDCPTGFSAAKIGGGRTFVYPTDNCPEGPEFWRSETNTIPGFLFMCRSSDADAQGAFFGFERRVNEREYLGKSKSMCVTEAYCQSAYKPYGSNITDLTVPGGKHKVLVAIWGCEYVYASYTPRSGAYIGGFYLTFDSRPSENWINPATGVTSCPSGYTAHLLFSVSATDPNRNVYPHKSYVCILQ